LDADNIEFPLILRKWEVGDYFFPLGMTQKKKLSDFFIDQKMDRFQKEKIWVLESLGKIIWLVGHRIDNRYKITDATKKVLQLTLQ
jgi:tRNA(Ile)-lysidine synthase